MRIPRETASVRQRTPSFASTGQYGTQSTEFSKWFGSGTNTPTQIDFAISRASPRPVEVSRDITARTDRTVPQAHHPAAITSLPTLTCCAFAAADPVVRVLPPL